MIRNHIMRSALLFFIIFFSLIILFTSIFNKPTLKTSINSKAQTPPASIILLSKTKPTAPSPIPFVSTTNWTPYKNRQYAFNLSYPQDWQLQEQPNVFGIEIQKVDKQGLGVSISIRVLDNLNKLPIKDFAIAQAYPRENGTYDDPQLISVGGTDGYKLTYLPKGLLVDLFLPYREGVLNIFAGGDIDLASQKNKDYYNGIITQILDSFKFSQ